MEHPLLTDIVFADPDGLPLVLNFKYLVIVKHLLKLGKSPGCVKSRHFPYLRVLEYQTGHSYQVPCALIRLKEDGREYAIPVFEHPHTDEQFNFPHRHYHIDGRFEIHPRMKHRFQIEDGYTLTVILPGGSKTYDFIGLQNRLLICERSVTGLLFPAQSTNPENLAAYEQWYRGFIGKTCKGRQCPHLGTEMLEQNGTLVCPMHHLTADPVTRKIMERIN